MLLIVSTHPIQYYSPLWVDISRNIESHVLYLYANGVNGAFFDDEFNTAVKWDIDLLSGYQYSFLSTKTYDLDKKFLKINFFSFIKLINKLNPNSILIPGWGYYDCMLIAIICKIKGIKILIRGDSNYRSYNPRLRNALKNFYLKFYFSFVDYFLYVGLANKRLYKIFNIKDSKLIYSPHAIDNKRFISSNAIPNKGNINIIFVGKYVDRKNPLIFLDLAEKINCEFNEIVWTMVGDGPLAHQVNNRIKFLKRKNVRVKNIGFINQSNIVDIYNSADIIILPSIFETWGLVINEAMSCNVVPVVSNQCGCSDDLVSDLDSNLVFEDCNLQSLIKSTEYAINNLKMLKLKIPSQIKKFEYSVTTNNLIRIL